MAAAPVPPTPSPVEDGLQASGIGTGSPPSDTVRSWLASLDAALRGRDAATAASLFEEGGLWRDLVCFTWNLKTCEGRGEIAAMLAACRDAADPRDWALDGEASAASSPVTGDTVEGWIRFRTSALECRGYLRLRGGRAWTLLTAAQGLTEFPEPRGANRPAGAEHGARRDRTTWLDEREREARELGRSVQPYAVVVGGGQGALALAARLRQARVPTIVVERNRRAGDSWRRRYKSLCLHDPVWYDHLPYLPFPDTWPVFTPKDKIGDWLEMYAKVMEINYWASTTCKKAEWDEAAQEWAVHVRRIADDGTAEDITLRPKQLIMATGMSGRPSVPVIPGAKDFEGDYHHSSQHPGAEPYRGKHCVILGSNNSAHDIAADLWENGAASVTMVQRSSTLVIRSQTFTDLITGPLYSETAVQAGITTDKADMLFASLPYKVLPAIQRAVTDVVKERDAEFYDALRARGFLLDFGDDGSGLFLKYLRRGSGYYIDVGASGLVISGEVGLRAGVSIARVNRRSVTLTDGAELPADLVVLATGFGCMNGWAEELISKDAADRVGRCWGLGSSTTKDPGPWEGELRNMWKPTAVPALWFHGGNLHQSRHYSKYLALQITARYEGLPTPVYGQGKVHHIA